MSIIKDYLGSSESLIKNETALDYNFIPKLIPYREAQQRFIASCIKPLFQRRNGKNLLIYGSPGVGKTVAVRHLFNEIEEETEEVAPVYINCWQKNTTYKVALEICDIIGYKFTQNKKTEELFSVIESILNKKSVVFAFDEIDKVEDFDFLYTLLENIFRRTILLITNFKTWHNDLDERVKSRLLAEMLEFKPYNLEETKGILKQRMEYAFNSGVFSDDAFDAIVKKTTELKDIRSGLHLMREAALEAENASSRKITIEHTQKAIKKFDEFTIKNSAELTEDEKFILDIIKSSSGMRIGELYRIYQEKGGQAAYKTFQRKIKRLYESNFINIEKKGGGKEGNTTLVNYGTIKKLTEF